VKHSEHKHNDNNSKHNEHRFEGRKALKGTVKQYIIKGVAGYDAKSFLDKTRQIMIDLLT
jgi:hypothetical protein